MKFSAKNHLKGSLMVSSAMEKVGPAAGNPPLVAKDNTDNRAAKAQKKGNQAKKSSRK